MLFRSVQEVVVIRWRAGGRRRLLVLVMLGEETDVVVAERVEGVSALFAVWTGLWREICGGGRPKFKHGSLRDRGQRAG